MRLRSVQILRGIAAIAVVAHHALPNGSRIGAAGVDLFFVISGFIMMTTCSSGRRAGEFLADRAWRIYPMWLVAVVPWLLMAPHTTLEVVRSLTLWPVYGNHFLNPALDVGWTLSFELLFYLAFALALATRAAVPLAIFGLCFVLGSFTNSVLFWFLGSPLIFEFLLGVAIAQIPCRASLAVPMIVVALTWFMLSPATYYDQAFGHGAQLRVLSWGVPAAMMLHGIRSLEEYFTGAAFETPVLLGSASYSIYLFHQLVLIEWQGLLGIVISAAFGIGAYLFLERHIMRVRPRWRTSSRLREERSMITASAE